MDLLPPPESKMPRKSRILRLEQATLLSEAWTSSMHANDWRHRFIIDMVSRLERNRGTSTKQRNWLDQLIEDGVPAEDNKNPELSAQVENAIAGFDKLTPTYQWEADVLRDMLPRVAAGRSMSEKQNSLLTRLIFDGEQLAAGNIWHPTPEMREDLVIAVKLFRGYTHTWKNERPGVCRSVDEVIAHLSGSDVLKCRSAKKVLDAVSGRMKTIKSPRFKTGDIGKLTPFVTQSDGPERVICMSEVRVNDRGAAENDWLLSTGELKAFEALQVAKR
jgi:hypothetical protein